MVSNVKIDLLRVGFVTIGQSPRKDIIGEILPEVKKFEIIEAGALDNLSEADIEELKPEKGDEVLVSRLKDGKQVIMGKKKLLPLLQEAINRVFAAGASFAVMLCTDTFELPKTPIPLIQPGKIMRKLVKNIISEQGRLGLVIPLRSQRERVEGIWRELIGDVKTIIFSPYSSEGSILSELKILRDRDLIVMDCMGYRLEHEQLIRYHTKRPVLLPKKLIPLLIEVFYQNKI